MSDDQILTYGQIRTLPREVASALQFAIFTNNDRDVVIRHLLDLRAQVAAMAEWAAKVPHAMSCASRDKCPRCRVNMPECRICNGYTPDCNCHLSTLPADLIARGRELLEAMEELKRLKGEK